MSYFQPLSLSSAAIFTNTPLDNVKMSKLDDRRPLSFKYCDVYKNSFIRYSVLNNLIHDPNWHTHLNNIRHSGSAKKVGGISWLVNKPTISFTVLPTTDNKKTDACLILTSNNYGGGFWGSERVIGGPDGLTVTVAIKVGPMSDSLILQLKGMGVGGTGFGDALLFALHSFSCRNRNQEMLSGSPMFMLSEGKKTVLTVRFISNGVEFYQDGVLTNTLSSPGFEYDYELYAVLVCSSQTGGWIARAGTGLYDVLIHDYDIGPSNITLLHNALASTYMFDNA